jgi:hypothetical protein
MQNDIPLKVGIIMQIAVFGVLLLLLHEVNIIGLVR